MAHDQLFHDQRRDPATVIVFLSPDEKNPTRAWKKRPISNKAESLTRVTARAFASAGHVGVKGTGPRGIDSASTQQETPLLGGGCGGDLHGRLRNSRSGMVLRRIGGLRLRKGFGTYWR